MNYDTFVDMVAQRAEVDSDTAVDLSRGTLQTLADRLTGGEAIDLAAQLPQPLQAVMRSPQDAAEPFGAQEFIGRVAERATVDETAARTGVRAVLTTVREAVTGGEFDDVMSQLPREFRDLVEPVLMPGGRARRR
ncbi:DUF2267 domain-containing protein [Micromonospora sp. NBC_01796]|uniref:DUF2267 domain-containing protein n=1 Tax=Micromonospora sp. NBC_01796 TaxID=2975987 RepID=UPI002DDC6A83|nr:DUF2267 domain-containing protein [Micromonospora sp. NBC_01796]WSA84895.1 DUF2267 domain-containing protein [Micromonospora sp. NBC_01796]